MIFFVPEERVAEVNSYLARQEIAARPLFQPILEEFVLGLPEADDWISVKLGLAPLENYA